MSAEVARILREAADLLEPEGRWTQGAYARKADQSYTNPGDPRAVCWCVSGALMVNTYGEGAASYVAAAEQLHTFTGEPRIPWNDDPQRTQSEVIAALRAAANEAERS